MGSKNNDAVTFLKALYQHCEQGFLNLRFLPSAKNIFIPLSEIDSIPAILEDHKGQNAYFGVAIRQDGDGTKQGIIEIPALLVDLDLYNLPDEKKEESRQRYKNFPLKPTVVIDSGGGRYLLWMLKESVSKEEIPKVENLNRRLTSYFHGDMSATDASRILRIPGSLNHKYQHIPRVVIKEFHPERQYQLDDFEILPQLEATESGQKPHLPEGWEKELLSGIKEGERNNALTKLAGRCFGKGFSREETLLLCGGANSQYLPPLLESEVVTIIDSIWKTHQRNHPDEAADEIQDKEKRPGVNLRLTTLDDVFQYQEPKYLIDPILIRGTVNALGAYTGVGKSIITLSIIKSILTGEPLWGRYSVVETGPVLLVDEETPKSFLRERLEKMGFDKSLPLYFLHFQDVKLDRDDCFNALMTKVEEVKPILVVIDSLIRVHRQKENESTMSLVGDRIRKIANWGTTNLVIHHHGKGDKPLSEKLRGSSDIPAGVDIEYALIPKDDYLVFQSVKTRTKPLTPIRLKMDVSEKKIEITYQGVEIGERGEILNEVINILDEGEAAVKEIHEALKGREVEVGINTLRDILKGAVGKELTEEKGLRGKKVYRQNPASQLHTPIYTRETVKVEGDKGPSFTDKQLDLYTAREDQTIDRKGLEGSFTASRNSFREGKKLDLYEGEI